MLDKLSLEYKVVV